MDSSNEVPLNRWQMDHVSEAAQTPEGISFREDTADEREQESEGHNSTEHRPAPKRVRFEVPDAGNNDGNVSDNTHSDSQPANETGLSYDRFVYLLGGYQHPETPHSFQTLVDSPNTGIRNDQDSDSEETLSDIERQDNTRSPPTLSANSSAPELTSVTNPSSSFNTYDRSTDSLSSNDSSNTLLNSTNETREPPFNPRQHKGFTRPYPTPKLSPSPDPNANPTLDLDSDTESNANSTASGTKSPMNPKTKKAWMAREALKQEYEIEKAAALEKLRTCGWGLTLEQYKKGEKDGELPWLPAWAKRMRYAQSLGINIGIKDIIGEKFERVYKGTEEEEEAVQRALARVRNMPQPRKSTAGVQKLSSSERAAQRRETNKMLERVCASGGAAGASGGTKLVAKGKGRVASASGSKANPVMVDSDDLGEIEGVQNEAMQYEGVKDKGVQDAMMKEAKDDGAAEEV